jgi:hypothetical protein
MSSTMSIVVSDRQKLVEDCLLPLLAIFAFSLHCSCKEQISHLRSTLPNLPHTNVSKFVD